MISKYFVLSCVLLQALGAVACQNTQPNLSKPNNDLRRSQGGCLSKSQELARSPQPPRAAGMYYASPSWNRVYNLKQDITPIDRYYNDCP